MNPEALVMMVASWGVILVVTAYCLYRLENTK
ncbi:MAG: hypothetical protein BWY76_00449 [bacterium ADurb.Bin429]|nr:MAG: hypothetical protein BWY76_00449 [bacterium ADurb.Bin429]